MKFKKLEIKSESGSSGKMFFSKHIRKTLIFIVIGSLFGFLYYYLSQGRHIETMIPGDVIKSLLLGGFFGFFITNSPCARNKC